MKKRIFALTLTLSFLQLWLIGTAYMADRSTFPDVPPGANYSEAVETLAELGILQGDDAGNFNPNSTITRAEAATVICRLLDVEQEAELMTQQFFSDVPSSHWAVGYIAKAAELGIISGYGDGNFGPSDPVTQQQMIKMLVCARGYDSEAQESGGYPSGYIAVAQELGVTNGVNSIVTESAPRSVVAQLVYNTMQVGYLDNKDMYEYQEW